MIKNITIISALCIFISNTANAQEDTRQFVMFPENLQQQMMSNMRDHMVALNEILEYLSFDDLDKAAEVAENRLGLSSRHSHGTANLAEYMPKEMKQAGYEMHSSASRFAQVAKEGDVESAYEALTAITSSCVACHAAYRIK